ncbi:MAG: hypothetical protein IPJ57_20590 [Gemmatimonadetes bacterium]|nr:hypothetical protein [Gemmatimonadota bacterium]
MVVSRDSGSRNYFHNRAWGGRACYRVAAVRSNAVTVGPGDIGYGPYCPQFDADGPDDEKMTLPALLRDLNRQLALAGTALAAKDERACRLQLGLMLDNLRIEFPEWSP